MSIIVRKQPWDNVPPWAKEIRRTNTIYYLFSIWLRNNHPDKKTFMLRQLSEEFHASLGYVRNIVSDYRLDSKMFMIYLPKPKASPAEQWKYTIGKLHADGFYFVNPDGYLSPSWCEPSYQQFVNYTSSYVGDTINRFIGRLSDAIALSLPIDGLDLKKELGDQFRHKALIESCSECKFEYKCVPPSGFKCPYGKTWEEGEIESSPKTFTEQDLRAMLEEYRRSRWK